MRLIGEVKELLHNNDYPSIKTLIHKPIKEKDKIIQYMKKSEIIAVAPAISRDVLDPEIKISELYIMSDGSYKWRSDIIYYVEKYDLALPQEFIDHVLVEIQKE